MRIVVFGKNGMLGNYVYSYFKTQGYDIVGLTRDDLNITKASYMDVYTTLWLEDENTVVINCAGLIKQRTNTSKFDFVMVNTVFPHWLQKACDTLGCHLIHVTTDCVFNGLKGGYVGYTEKDIHDTTDVYGVTKSLGEPDKATVIRTSIIGEELRNQISLLEWVKSNKGKKVNGYTNHIWNGITCLQFAKICEDIIINNDYWEGVHHITSPDTVNKYELVKMISDVYELGIEVTPFISNIPCDRSMKTIYRAFFSIPHLKEQLIEMRKFGDKLGVE